MDHWVPWLVSFWVKQLFTLEWSQVWCLDNISICIICNTLCPKSFISTTTPTTPRQSFHTLSLTRLCNYMHVYLNSSYVCTLWLTALNLASFSREYFLSARRASSISLSSLSMSTFSMVTTKFPIKAHLFSQIKHINRSLHHSTKFSQLARQSCFVLEGAIVSSALRLG